MKVQWGGGILESKRKNPKDLQRFTKNKKQKGIAIGSIVGVILLIGGFTLYKTFALYKEEQSFDVLNGVIPSFVYGDVKLAIQVDGNKQTDIPNKKEDYVVEPKCDNGEIEWDYENWAPIIKNITKETRCSLNFVKNNNIGTLGKILNINNLSIETLLTDANIETLTKSKSGMTYLAKSPELVQQMQASNDKYTENIKKKILDSEVISEDLKYEAGLPCYLLKKKQVLKAAGGISIIRTYNGSITTGPSSGWFDNSLILSVAAANNKAIIGTVNQIDTKKYSKIKLDYGHRTDASSGNVVGIVKCGLRSYPSSWIDYNQVVQDLKGTETFNNYSTSNYENSTIETEIQNQPKMSFLLALEHDEHQYNTLYITLNTIALY